MLCYVLGQLTTGIVAASQKLTSWERRAVWSSSLEKKKKTNQKINKYQTPIFKKPQKIKKKIIKKTKSDIRVYQGRFPEIQNLSSVVLSLKN